MNLKELSFGIGCTDGKIYLGRKKLLELTRPDGSRISEWADKPRKVDVTTAVGCAIVDYAVFNGGGFILSDHGVPKWEISVREIGHEEAEEMMMNAASKEKR